MISHRYTIQLPPGGLDLGLCLATGQTFRWEQLEDGSWLGVDGPAWFHLSLVPDGLDVRSSAREDHLKRLFRYPDNPIEIHRELVRRMPELEDAFVPRPGLRLLSQADPVEVLFTFLCTSNNHLSRITSMVRKLAAYGEVLSEVEGRRLLRFPRIDRLSLANEQDLRDAGFGYRAAFIPAAARAVAEHGGEEWLDSLRDKPYGEAHAALRSLPGVGPKVADCVALFGLGHMRAVPVDVHVYRAAAQWLIPDLAGKPLTDARYRQVGDHFRDRFGEWAGWAQQMLFTEQISNSERVPSRLINIKKAGRIC